LEDGFDPGEEGELVEDLVNAAVRPLADEAGFVAVEEPGGDLLDGGLLEVIGERVVAGVVGIVGEIITAEVEDPGLLTPGSKRLRQGNDACPADEILNIVNVDPIFAFAGFELKPLDEPKRIVDRQDFGLVGGEFFGSFGTPKDAVAFFVEMSAGGEEELGEDVVVVGDGEVETGAEGGEGGEHTGKLRVESLELRVGIREKLNRRTVELLNLEL
jgi:hypothetical protein